MAFNGRFVLNLIQFAARQQVGTDELVALSGSSIDELGQESCIIEDVAYNAVIEQAIASSGDAYFGLHAGEHLNMSAAGIVVQIAQTSETVKQAMELCCKYANLGCSALPLSLFEEDSHYRLTMTPRALWQTQSPLAVRHTTEGMLAFLIRQFGSLTHTKHKPIAIHVTWPEPMDSAEYRRVYDAPIYFGKSQVAILLKKSHLHAQVTTSDYRLLNILVAYAEEKSAKLRNEQGLVAMVKESIIKLLKPSFPTIGQVASHLNMSQRTLQRRLKKEGYVYQTVLDNLKMEFAESYLKRPDLTIGEVAYLLNYVDASTFTRSFRRWVGKTPGEYRAELLSMS